MPKAFRIHKNGGPEALAWEEVPVGAPGPGEARVRHHAVGLNYVKIGVNQRYALKNAAQAHHDLEARRTTGSTVLVP